MSDLSFLAEKGNDFSKSDINKISINLFKIFQVELSKKEKSIQDKNEVLKLFLELLNKTLYSGLIKDSKEKVYFIKTINKLKIQKELMELISSENSEKATIELLKASKKFGKKAQSSVKK